MILGACIPRFVLSCAIFQAAKATKSAVIEMTGEQLNGLSTKNPVFVGFQAA